jgi:hypothetical protein
MDTVKRFLENCDAFAYSEDNPNAGFRYLQPTGRKNRVNPAAKRPEIPCAFVAHVIPSEVLSFPRRREAAILS